MAMWRHMSTLIKCKWPPFFSRHFRHVKTYKGNHTLAQRIARILVMCRYCFHVHQWIVLDSLTVFSIDSTEWVSMSSWWQLSVNYIAHVCALFIVGVLFTFWNNDNRIYRILAHCLYIYIRLLTSAQNKCGLLCMNRPFVTFEWAESWWKHVLLRSVDLLI